MRTTLTAHRLAEVLPGAWSIGASNMLFWLDGRHGEPVFTFSVASASPLLLTETIEFDADDGHRRVLRGKTKMVRDSFVWRGEGLHMVVTQRWRVLGIDDGGSVLVVDYRGNRVVPGGLTVLVRKGSEPDELRTLVASNAAMFGITPEQFASLSWMA